jgi:hypothetical protein
MKALFRWILFLLTICSTALAGTKVKIRFLNGSETLDVGKIYVFNQSKDSVRFDHIKLYASLMPLTAANKMPHPMEKKYFLINIEDSSSLSFEVPDSAIDHRWLFQIGIDSLTQVSGVKGGCLDPTIGMYWTWLSGYIHLKMEGWSNQCHSRNQQFKLHVGGFREPFSSIRDVKILQSLNSELLIYINVKDFIHAYPFGSQPEVMQPGNAAVGVIDWFMQTISNTAYKP